LTDVVHLNENINRPASLRSVGGQHHRNRWTTSPEYAQLSGFDAIFVHSALNSINDIVYVLKEAFLDIPLWE